MATTPGQTRLPLTQENSGTPPVPPGSKTARHPCANWRRHPYLPLLILLLAAAFLLLLRPSIRGNDGVQNYAYLRSLLFDGDLDFTNEYAHYQTRHPEWFNHKEIPRDPVTGRPINLYGVGNALLWAPWVLAAHAAGHLANALGASLVLDGYSRLYEFAVGAGSCFYASAGILVIFTLLRRRFGDGRAFWACLTVWLASPLLFYMYFHPSMSHANSFFLASVLLAIYLGGDGPGRWCALGAVAGLVVLTRFQDGVFLTALAIGELFRLRDSRAHGAGVGAFARSRLPRYALFASMALLAFSPQFLAWHALQGSALSGPRAYVMQGSLRPWAPVHLADALFGSFHGLFHWHPLLLAAAAGLLVARTRSRRLRLMALAAFAAQAWVIGSWSFWWAGASFGHRMFISTLPFLAVGMATVAGRTGRRARAARLAIVFFIFWNFGLLVQYGLPMIPRQAPVSLSTIARNNLVELPRLVLRKAKTANERE